MQAVALHTRRLTLAIPTDADADAVTTAAQDPEVPRWTTLPAPYTRADADAYIGAAEARWESDTEYAWGIRHDDVWVGMVSLHALSGDRTAELGYWMAAPARGRGFVTEAARAVIDFGFAPTPQGAGLLRIGWRAVVGNVASARTARTLGLRYEGTVRQALVDPRGRHDGWLAGLLHDDDRTPQPWPILS